MGDLGDSRTMKWESIRSPVPMFGSLLVYLFAIYFAIPRFMRKKQAYSLKGYIQWYNIFQVITNLWLTYCMVKNGGCWSVVWRYCDIMDDNCGYNTQKQLELVWWALWIRVLDFTETMVFALRKKDRQISFLHVYHHITTPLFLWIFMKYFSHGFMLFMAMINSATHTIMYLYYFLSTYGPSMQRRLMPFKRWITTIQMTQILCITLPTAQGFFFNCDNRGWYFSIMVFFNGLINFALFWKFYLNSYIKLKKA